MPHFGIDSSRDALAGHRLFQTSDVEEARSLVSRVFCDHRMALVGREQQVNCEMYARPIRGIGLGRLRYGASVLIDPGCLTTFALVQMPVRGLETVQHGGENISSNSVIGTVISPTLPLRMQHVAGTEKLFVRIDRDVLERCCRQHVGGELRQPVEFAAKMDFREARCASWVRLMHWLYNELAHARPDISKGGAMLDSPLFAAQVEQMVITALLLAQPNNYSARLTDDSPSIAPHFVKRAEGIIEDRAHEPMSIGDLAEAAGVSTRSLFAGFRKYRNTTPKQFLKDTRLRRVREDLLRANPGTDTVTRIAVRWGFSHLGHFANDYKRQFGECPSATLNR